MAGKLLIKCDLVTITGMHIGGTDTFSAIGAIDSPVIRDAYTGRPIVPGSSLKGKLRSLLARKYAKDIEHLPDFNEDEAINKRLFGSSTPVCAARLQFSDCFIRNTAEMKKKGVGLTESKSENTIDRKTSVANPRQIERVVPGVVFTVKLSYNEKDPEETKKDLERLAEGMKLLEMDYLGGHGSRGSGRVSFRNFCVQDDNEQEQKEYTEIFDKVSDYELFSDSAVL